MKTLLLASLLMLWGLATGCAQAAVSEGRLRVGGIERSYRLFVPSTISSARPAALVVALHGGYGTGETMAEQSGFDALAEREGFLVVYPDGLKRAWNAGGCCGPPMERNIDDVAFIRAVIADLRARQVIDAARIYGTGFSNGAMLLHRIACEAPGTFAAIAPVSGGLMLPACAATQGTSALMIQGRLDERIPWDGGVFNDSYRPSIRELVTGLAQRGHCGAEEQSTERGEGYECYTRVGCSAGQEVSWCSLARVGHQWAGGKTFMPRVLGPNDGSFPTSEKIWGFFQRHRAHARPASP